VKVYISADIEGVAGITHWDEARKSHAAYPDFREAMTREVIAACEGAIAAGATDILIKDAHGTGRNVIAEHLPSCARLIRGWSGHPLMMLQELDASFAAVCLVGWHAGAGWETNPLAHTLTGTVAEMRLNGAPTSEFRLAAYSAASVGVPVVFVSGDDGLIADVATVNARIHGLAVSRGVGDSTISLAPAKARADIRAGVEKALGDDRKAMLAPLAPHWVLEVVYANPTEAYKMAQYPGARHIGKRTVRLETDGFLDVMRALLFIA
jgi:D-amino peptidase